jgi:fumarate hydratase, class II
MTAGETRVERDSLGELRVPVSAYYGVQTMRAQENFPISDLRFPRRFIEALAQIKGTAAAVNRDLGLLDAQTAERIIGAAQEVAEGTLDDQFVLDIFQTGSGTSTNMNANEVIASRANELAGGKRGDKSPVHPNDHVNMGQSSNDVIPTAIHLAALAAIHADLIPALDRLERALRQKAEEFMPVIKTGRTHLQDATPVRLGQEFEGYAGQIERGKVRLQGAIRELGEVALGGTAVGTGINTHAEFASRICAAISQQNGFTIAETTNHFQAQSTLDGVVAASGARAGAEPADVVGDLQQADGDRRQPAEDRQRHPLARLRPARRHRRDRTPRRAARLVDHAGQGQPRDRRVGGDGRRAGPGQRRDDQHRRPVGQLRAERDDAGRRLQPAPVDRPARPRMVEQGLMLGTALAPRIGYDAAAKIAKTAAEQGRTIRELAREMTNLTEDELNDLLDPAKMTEPGTTLASSGG